VRFRDEAFLDRFIQESLQKSFLRSEYKFPERLPSLSINPSRDLAAALPNILPWEMQESPEAHTSQVPSDQLELPCEFSDSNIIGLYDKYLIAGGQGFPSGSPLFAGKKGEGLVLVDLSLARMRIAYEEFLLPQDSKVRSFQRLLIPCKIQLSKPEAVRLEKRLADLRHLGLEIQIIGEREILIEGMSCFWEIDDVKEAIAASLDEIEKETIEKNLLHRLALRASGFARWNKEKSSLSEARALLHSLMKSKDPYFSPRGKPIMALLDERILERLFYGS
jgi:DNA mismatch repair ATPase MutL